MWSPLGQGPFNTTAQWHPEPLRRGTFSILASCAITLSLCLWTSLHLNIPEDGKAGHQKWRKTKWLFLGLIAPEMVSRLPAVTRWCGWLTATRLHTWHTYKAIIKRISPHIYDDILDRKQWRRSDLKPLV